MKKKWFYVLIIIIPFNLLVAQTDKQTELTSKDEIKKIAKELEKLKEDYSTKLDALEALIKQIKSKIEEKEQEDELAELLAEAQSLSEKKKEKKTNISKKFHSGTRRQQGLNPNISLGGDFFGGVSSDKSDFISDPSDYSYGTNKFDIREVEVALVASLDPFARGKAFFSITVDGISIEEAYIEWLNLPLNMNLKGGKFYAEFGPLNRYHDHALPQFDRPKAIVNLFSNAGLGGIGLSSNFLLPTLFWSDATNLDLAVVTGGNDFSFTSQGKTNLLFIGHLTTFYDVSDNSFIEWRLGGVTGKNDPNEHFQSYIGSLGLIYKWVPVGQAKYKTFDWKTEFLYSFREEPTKNVKSFGFYSSVQNKLDSQFWLSGRVGYSQLPFDNKQTIWDLTAAVDYWQSEFVLVRFQYQYNIREMFDVYGYNGKLPNDHSITIQVSWAMGPHKHEAY